MDIIGQRDSSVGKVTVIKHVDLSSDLKPHIKKPDVEGTLVIPTLGRQAQLGP